MEYFMKGLRNWSDFAGKATRKDYWMFVLIYILISIAVSLLDNMLGTAFLGLILSLALPHSQHKLCLSTPARYRPLRLVAVARADTGFGLDRDYYNAVHAQQSGQPVLTGTQIPGRECNMTARYKGIVPYLFFDDADAALAWYARVFDFEEIGRWSNDDGRVQNAEMRVGDTELWLDGSGRRKDIDERPTWVGIWVDDVDAMYRRVQEADIACEPPVDREFGVRMLTIDDGMGHLWGFMRRLPRAA